MGLPPSNMSPGSGDDTMGLGQTMRACAITCDIFHCGQPVDAAH
jgi:hypothetical protein